MGGNRASSLVLVLLLLLLESTVGIVPYQQCCPQDDQHAFIQEDKICNSSHTLGLVCNNDSEVIVLMKRDWSYWFTENNASVIFGLPIFGLVLSNESFCVANVIPVYTYFNNGKKQQYQDGIVLCKETEPTGTYLGAEPLSYVACMLISAIGCFLTFLTYILVPVLRKDLFNKCLISASLCFTFTYVLFGITVLKMHWLSHRYCSYQFLFIYFWTTAALFWTNVVSFHIWRTVVFKRFPINEDRLSKVYHFWGWGIPLILSIIGTLLEAFTVSSEITLASCRIHSVYGMAAISITCPVLFFFNFLYFIWTICKLWKQEVPSSSDLKFTRFQRLTYKSFMYLKLLVLMGIPWIIRYATTLIPENTFIRILFNTLTLLQGLYIFLLLVVFQKKALLGLAGQFAYWGCPCPFVTTNFAVTINEGNEDVSKMEAQSDAEEFNSKQTNTES